MEITRVGFGAWATGGGEWGPQDDAASIASINRALEHGINWIDTAPIYGLGHSEEVVGRALKGRSAADKPYVFSKCGLVWTRRIERRRQSTLSRPPRFAGSARHRCGGWVWSGLICTSSIGLTSKACPLKNRGA